MNRFQQRMPQFLASFSGLGLCVAYMLSTSLLFIMWEQRIAQRIGAYEHIGWVSGILRVLYIIFFCTFIFSIYWGIRWVVRRIQKKNQVRSSRNKFWLFSSSIFSFVLIYSIVTLPWIGFKITGLLNVQFDQSMPVKEEWLVVKLVKHSKGKSGWLLTRNQEQQEVKEFFTLPEIGHTITLTRRQGALLMPYLSEF